MIMSDYEQNSISTPSRDFFTDVIFSSWSLINECHKIYVSMCVTGPVKIKFNKNSYLTTPLFLAFDAGIAL